MEEESSEPKSGAFEIAQSAITAAAGIPVPPEVRKSLFKALDRLLGAAVDVPAAWLESKSQAIRDDTLARSAVVSTAGVLATQAAAADPDFAKRALNRYAAKILRQQVNSESAARIAIEDLRKDPPKADSPGEVSDDWLERFTDAAEQVSDEQLQRYLGKLLANEIRKPGSFSLSTIRLVSTLSPSVAASFADLANLATVFVALNSGYVITDPYGPATSNGLASIGFPYPRLTELQDEGLVKADLGQWTEIPTFVLLAGGIRISGQEIHFKVAGDKSRAEAIANKVRLTGVAFTRSGQELFPILQGTPNAEHTAKTLAWISSKFGVEALDLASGPSSV